MGRSILVRLSSSFVLAHIPNAPIQIKRRASTTERFCSQIILLHMHRVNRNKLLFNKKQSKREMETPETNFSRPQVSLCDSKHRSNYISEVAK